MNSRERLLATIRREPADRTPCAPYVSPRTVEQMHGDDWATLLRHTDVTMSVAALGDFQIFGGQAFIDGSTSRRLGDRVVDEVRTPQGTLHSERVITREADWKEETFYKGRADVDKILSIEYAPPNFELDEFTAWEEKVGDEGLMALSIPSAFRFCLAFFGPQQLYFTMADDIALIEELVAVMNERLALYIEACCEKGVRSYWMGGSEHCGPGVVNPRLFSRLVTPYDARIVAIIHRYGGIVNYHTHGKLKDILDDIAEIGVDVMSPIETGLRGDVTLADVKREVGDRICLKGNLDDMAYLALAPEDEVRAAAEDCLRQAAEGGGYILSGADAGIYSPQWVQSFLVMAKVAAKWGG